MRFEADTHSHTLASGHAYSTIKEMAAAAEAKGLKSACAYGTCSENAGNVRVVLFSKPGCRSKKMRRNSPLNGSGSKYNG